MTPGSTGSRPRASDGSVSEPTSKASSCRTVSGSGTSPPGECEHEKWDDFRRRVSEDVDDELTDVVVDTAARLNRSDDRREVVVRQDHRCSLTGHVRARDPHRDSDVCSTQRRRVIDSVSGHCDDVTQLAERFGDSQLRLGGRASEHELFTSCQ